MTVLALTGGVGGAKLALGLAQVLEEKEVVFLVNTGDDFEHLGLKISPDIDTLTYTLAGIENRTTGWSREGDTLNFLSALEELGGETWFRLGDKDLALHAMRTNLLREGESLTGATAHICSALGVKHQVLPMSDDPVRTVVTTTEGALPFQEYFVRRKCEPAVSRIDYEGAEAARLNPCLKLDEISSVIICPSNPYLSVDPLLSINELSEFLRNTSVPVVAVSPIVRGMALKGPTAKLMKELGFEADARNVARHYQPFIKGFVLDHQDREYISDVERLGLQATALQTIMRTLDDRIELAKQVLEYCSTAFAN